MTRHAIFPVYVIRKWIFIFLAIPNTCIHLYDTSLPLASLQGDEAFGRRHVAIITKELIDETK